MLARNGKPPSRQPVLRLSGAGGSKTNEPTSYTFPGAIETVEGRGHERMKRIYRERCANRSLILGFNEKQGEHRFAAWLCRHACSFVLFGTKARATVIGFEREEDAEAFRRAFAGG